MKKNCFLLALSCISAIPHLYAQSSAGTTQPAVSRAQTTFNMPAGSINHRHIVTFNSTSKLTIELHDQKDYALLQDIDSLLRKFQSDFSFYKDSLHVPPSGSVRIDYAFTSTPGVALIRLKPGETNADVYVFRQGEHARLKTEQDTIRILLLSRTQNALSGTNYLQLTFTMRDYREFDQLVADRSHLQRVIDSLQKASAPAKPNRSAFMHRTTIYYDMEKDSWRRENGIYMTGEDGYPTFGPQRHTMYLSTNLGVGIVRGRIAPMATLALEYRWLISTSGPEYLVTTFSATPYCLFEKRASGGYTTNANWFLNAEIGSIGNQKIAGAKAKRITYGIGYLLKAKGDIFNGTTMKGFANITLKSGFTVSPELIATDNFRQVFPGVTFKFFW